MREAFLLCYNTEHMPQSADFKLFLESIMSIHVLNMGGAGAGIFGISGADNDVLNSLKKGTSAFATEYRKPTVDHGKLQQLSSDIVGQLQILQLMHTISEEKADRLMDQLQRSMSTI